MMKPIMRSISKILLIWLLLISMAVTCFAETDLSSINSAAFTPADDFSVAASAAMLVELNTGSVLYEQDADKMIYPASLTKIMTCLLAIENGNLNDELTVSSTALENLHPDGSSAELLVGETIRLEDLLYCIMLASANDGCNVVAEYISGSVDAFVALMNERAAQIGCTGTQFANTHGLHDENHYTTARDLAKISMVALENETFKRICTATSYKVPATNLSAERSIYTTNYLTSDVSTSQYYYSKAEGVKTGYTSQAGRCLITTATGNDLYLLSIVCGASTAIQANGDLLLENFTESKKLLQYGLTNFDYATVLSGLDTIAQISVNYSAGADSVVVAPNQTITTVLPSDYDESLLEKDVVIDNPEGIDAPVAEGDKLGSITVTYDGVELGSADLVAITDVARSETSYYKSQLTIFIQTYWWMLIIGLFGILILIYLILYIRAVVRRNRRRKARAAARAAAKAEQQRKQVKQ